MTARVYEFPGERSCRLCTHFIAWSEEYRDAGRCQLFDKAIRHTEAVAAECHSYQPEVADDQDE